MFGAHDEDRCETRQEIKIIYGSVAQLAERSVFYRSCNVRLVGRLIVAVIGFLRGFESRRCLWYESVVVGIDI